MLPNWTRYDKLVQRSTRVNLRAHFIIFLLPVRSQGSPHHLRYYRSRRRHGHRWGHSACCFSLFIRLSSHPCVFPLFIVDSSSSGSRPWSCLRNPITFDFDCWSLRDRRRLGILMTCSCHRLPFQIVCDCTVFGGSSPSKGAHWNPIAFSLAMLSCSVFGPTSNPATVCTFRRHCPIYLPPISDSSHPSLCWWSRSRATCGTLSGLPPRWGSFRSACCGLGTSTPDLFRSCAPFRRSWASWVGC